MGTTWGQQQLWVQTGCKKHREYKIDEERRCATWQHRIGPSQQETFTCHHPISPCQHW
jgi:DNA modification methylase